VPGSFAGSLGHSHLLGQEQDSRRRAPRMSDVQQLLLHP